jgi:hypothetical protein
MLPAHVDPDAPHRPPVDALASSPQKALPAPIYSREDEPALYDEQQVVRCEALMIRGIRRPAELKKALGVRRRETVLGYIRRVHARWEMTGLSHDHARNRGAGLARLDLLEERLWTKLDAPGPLAPDTKESIVIIKTIADVQKQRSELLGLTEKVIERLGSPNSQAVTAFSQRAATHDQLARVAARALEMLESRAGSEHRPR